MSPRKTKKADKAVVEQQLIELVKLRPVIYQVSHPEHKNLIVIENAWRWIFDQLGDQNVIHEAQGCAGLWKNVWSQYGAFKRRMKGKSGQGSSSRPYFRHDQAMQFFDDKDEQEQSYSNVIVHDLPIDNAETSTSSGDVTICDNISLENESHDNTQHRPSKSRSHQSAAVRAAKVAKKSFDDQLIDCLKSPPADEFQNFGSTVGLKLKKISEQDSRVGLETQRDINNILYEAESKLL